MSVAGVRRDGRAVGAAILTVGYVWYSTSTDGEQSIAP